MIHSFIFLFIASFFPPFIPFTRLVSNFFVSKNMCVWLGWRRNKIVFRLCWGWGVYKGNTQVFSAMKSVEKGFIRASAEIMAPAAVQNVKNRNDRKLIVLTYILNEYLNLKKKTNFIFYSAMFFFCTKHLITTILCFSLKFSICFMRI